MLVFRFVRVMILSGPPAPKCVAEMFVRSDMVGEGGPAPAGRLELMTLERNERVPGIVGIPVSLMYGSQAVV